MSQQLPTIAAYPTKKVKLPLSGIEVLYRPFLVKEEKTLILTRESSDSTPDDTLNAMIDVAKACTFGKIDIEKLPLVDLELLFLKIRALSKGNISEVVYTCKNVPETIFDKDLQPIPNVNRLVCNNRMEVGIDLDSIEVTMHEGHQKQFDIPGTKIAVHMKYPTIQLEKDVYALKGKGNVIDGMNLLFKNSIAMITDGDNVYQDFTEDQIVGFLDSLSAPAFEEIQQKFFNRAPMLEKTIHLDCSSCHFQQDILLKGYQSFF